MFNGERLNVFPKIRNKTWIPALPLIFNIVPEVPATATGPKNKIKGIQIGKEEVKLFLYTDDMTL